MENRKVSFDIKANDHKFYEYTIDLSGYEPWNSSLDTAAQILIGLDGEDGDFKGRLEFDGIGFIDGSIKGAVRKPLIGAIRWDVWGKTCINGIMGFVLDKSFFTDHSYREPTYGWYDLDSPKGTQPDQDEILKEQHRMAYEAGLDFWAFDWSCTTIPGQNLQDTWAEVSMRPLRLYKEWDEPEKPKYCLILMPAYEKPGGTWDTYFVSKFIPELIEHFKDPYYVKLEGNRPLLIFHTASFLDSTGDWKGDMGALRQACLKAGLGTPYFADTSGVDAQGAASHGFDALTNYGPSSAPGYQTGHRSWDDMAAFDRDRLIGNVPSPDGFLRNLPGLSPVMDPRALLYYETPIKGVGPYRVWFDMPTYLQWEDHLRTTYDWMLQYPGRVTDPAAMLLYAWNEFIEGGPGIAPTKQMGTMFLDGIKAVTTGNYPSEFYEEINGDNLMIKHEGTWTEEFPKAMYEGCFNNDLSITEEKDASLEISRQCVRISVYATKFSGAGSFEIFIDNMKRPVGEVKLDGTVENRTLVFESEELENGVHTVRIVCTGGRIGIDTLKFDCKR